VLDEVVDDGEAPGSSGVVRGGLLLRRLLQGFRGGDASIGRRQWLIEHGEVLGRSRKKRGGWWCEEMVEARPPFIGAMVAGVLRRSRQGRGFSGGLGS
jgi:hypothetical protein